MCRSLLGMELLGSLDYAAKHLLAPGGRVVPSKVVVYAALAEVGRVTTVRGFDLSPMNMYRWYPHHEELRPESTPFRCTPAPGGPASPCP